MSLQLAAQHLSSQGRGNDSTLVHMSPREVKSLNDIAMAHGGQLSINPQTGLPEAGFLESILPMVAGAALNAAMPGAGMMVPALVGGGMALMTGSLEKGLMAGLGAYGGANLGSGLMASGTDAAVASAPEVTTQLISKPLTVNYVITPQARFLPKLRMTHMCKPLKKHLRMLQPLKLPQEMPPLRALWTKFKQWVRVLVPLVKKVV
jgi:hypothetical protein